MIKLYNKLDNLTSVSKLKDDDDDDKSVKHKNKYENDHKNFMLRDLLEVLQGPINLESSIILANTNKYDEIKDLCPALFRNGRMTPVHFGYIDADTLQDISLHFFNKKLEGYVPKVLSTSTSEIIELAFESLAINKNPFTYFNEKLQKLMK